jgi:hypothetical protein
MMKNKRSKSPLKEVSAGSNMEEERVQKEVESTHMPHLESMPMGWAKL